MDKDTWTAVDRYVSQMLIPPDPILDAVLRANEAAGLPPHHVSPSQGKLLYLLARLSEAGRIWRSAPSAGTAPSGSAEHCPPTAA